MDGSQPGLEVDIIKWLIGAVVGVLTVLYKLLHTRIVKLEEDVEGKVDAGTIQGMQALMKEHRDETRSNFTAMNQTLNAILLKLGNRNSHD